MGAGGSPCRSGRISGDSPPDQGCRGYRLRPLWVGRRGDLQGVIIGGAFVVCALEKSTPLGVGGGLAGAMAAPSATAPALGHLNFRGIGRKADGFSRHRTNNQGGLPPYLRAAIVPGRGRAALPWDPPSPWLYGGGYHLGRMDARRTALADTAQITRAVTALP